MIHSSSHWNPLTILPLLVALLATGWHTCHAQMNAQNAIVLEYMPFQDGRWQSMQLAIQAGMAKNGLKKFAQYSIETASDGSDSAALRYYWKFDADQNLVQEMARYHYGKGIDILKYPNGESQYIAQFIHFTECKVSATGDLVYTADTVITYPIDASKRLTDAAGRQIQLGIYTLSGEYVAINLWSGYYNIDHETDDGICLYIGRHYPSLRADGLLYYSKSGAFERMEIACIDNKACIYPEWWDSTITQTRGAHWLITTVGTGRDASTHHVHEDYLVKLNSWNQVEKKWALSPHHIRRRLVEKQFFNPSKQTFQATELYPRHLGREEYIYQLNEMGLPTALTVTQKELGSKPSIRRFMYNYFD